MMQIVKILIGWFTILSVVIVADNIPSYEIDALHDFFDATNGTYWTRFSWYDDDNYPGLWDFTNPQPCTDAWTGIWCNEDHSHITELQLNDMSLMGTLPSSLGNLSELTQLHLVQNKQLVGTVPRELSKLKKLEVFVLNFNGINDTIPEFLSEMDALVSIDLSTNRFHGTVPAGLGRLSRLKWLQLSSNYLTGTLPPELSNLTVLEQFSAFSMSGIVGTIPPELCKMNKLAFIQLAANSMTGTLPDCLGEMTALNQLDVAYNMFNGTLPNSIEKLANCYYLFLNGNYFTGTLPDLGKLTSLRMFNVFDNKMNGSIPRMDNNLELTMLYLSGNQFTGPIPAGLCNASYLNSLDLSYNLLSQHIPWCIFSHTSLNVIYLQNNRLTGPLPTEYNNHTMLTTIQLQNNLLSQQLPPKMFNTTVSVYSIYLFNNQFTGSIPEEVNQLDQIVELDLQGNHLTGTIPNLVGMTTLNTLALDGNHLTGEIPVTLGSVIQMQSMFLFSNLLTGSIPPELGHIKGLFLLAVNGNHLSGTIPIELSHLNSLVIFFAYGNMLSGKLDRVFNSTLQPNLQYVDVSKNQISGPIPLELFRAKNLKTFSAVSNCFTGSIPEQICDCKNLTTLALDGLMSASNCQMQFFPSWTSSYGLPNAVKGGMPNCLFAMPHMLSLHLSGNGLTGTLPSDLVISSSLQDLSLSHNNLKGDIPRQVQVHNWTKLDLSYNKFKGTLETDIHFTYYNGSLSLEVNRLSGKIPPSMHAAVHITILDGNLYECDTSRSDLPEHDSYRDIYECGSNALNYALYIWLLFLIGICLIAGLRYCLYTRNRKVNSHGSAWLVHKIKSWLDVFDSTGQFSGLHEPVPRLASLLAFGQFVAAFRNLILKLTALIVVVCLPVYLILSSYYDMYTYEYAWSASGCYLSGEVPSGIMFMIFLLFSAAVLYGLHQLIPRDAVVLEPFQNGQKSSLKWTYSECSQVGLLVLFNLVLVTAVNIGYVYVDHNYSSGIVRATMISVAIFKIVWKNLIVRLLLRYSESDDRQDGNEKSSTETNLSLAVFVTLFNNIAAPFIATCYVSSDCFYSVVSSPPKVKVSYEYLSCLYGSFTGNVTTCYSFDNMKLTETSYDPPFVYSFQCSSTFVTTYASVYVMMLAFEAFAVPLVMWLLAAYHGKVSKNKDRNGLLLTMESAIPKILQTIGDRVLIEADDGESKSLTKRLTVHEVQYVESAVFVVKLVNMFSILCTFGVLVPPIAVVCCVAVLCASINMQLFIGRLILQALTSSAMPVLWMVDKNCQHSSEMFLGSVWTLIPFVCIFFAIILFDTLGDSVGWQRALWAPIVMLVLPLLLWCASRVIGYSTLLDCIGFDSKRKRRSSGCTDSAGGELQRHVSGSGVVYTHAADYSPLRISEDDAAASKALIPCDDCSVVNTNL